MSAVIVVKCEHIFNTAVLEYTAYCNMFELVPQYIEPPLYEFRYRREPDKIGELTVKKMKS